MRRIKLDAPIVLAHGLFGFRRIRLGRLTLVSYFRGIPEYLSAAGNRVIVTRVPAVAGVGARVRVFAQEIERALPAGRFHIVGHSMGGLDARGLLADPAWARRVLSVTTIGTPHLGSALADLARLRTGPLYRLCQLAGLDIGGFLDVTRDAARAAHRAGNPPRSVRCFSVAGVPHACDVCWPLRPFHGALDRLEGPNDGLVSAESALDFGTALDPWPIDHLGQMNWFGSATGRPPQDSAPSLYMSALEHLARLGFGGDLGPEGADRVAGVARDSEVLDHQRFVARPGTRRLLAGAVEQDGDGHVAQDVGGCATAVEEPVDREEYGDLVRR